MTNLATLNKNDFTVTETGDAFISQRKAAQLCGVDHKSVQKWIEREGLVATHSVNENNQLSANSLVLVATYFAMDSRHTTHAAKNFYKLLAKAGAKAYIYHEAGYQMQAKRPEPKSALELAREQVMLLEHIRDLEIKHRQELLDKDNAIFDLRIEMLDNNKYSRSFKRPALYNLPRT